MRLSLSALLLSLCLSLPVAAELRLATLEYPPYCSQALPTGGSIVELTVRAFATQGHVAQVDFLPWARVRADLRSGNYQGALALWPQEIIEEQLIASRPLFYSQLGFFVRKSKPVAYQSLSELRGQRVGIVRGYGYPPNLLRSGFSAEEAVDDISNLRKLAARRFDLVLLERTVGDYLINQDAALRGRLHWQEPALERIPLFVGFTAQKPGQPDWAAIFARGLAELHSSGEYTRILQRYANPVR
ncbi:transporter substrate-binding domain-containing protein [Pseudomonas sp. J452]|uniref:substrate-binding periplasmic protein n=1 Tax=Pseudomonas sp. J452 TaxID=2898441 RepID=UPI0021AD7F71|nr:transporter substrate-binding domain-containing protein [Pseudomonas sp. J452]UUY06724.1 transporter substrate-binding domain-containing protein [Pseudomonas sp. J452]